MIRIITRIHGLPAALVACMYAAAVLTLVWLTEGGYLGDGMYGSLVMIPMAFPLSLVGSSLYGPLKNAIIGQRHDDSTYGWDYNYNWEYVLMGWPGIVMAIILALLLVWRRARPVGQALGWVLTAVVILAGVVITFDGWAPRRPYGWIFLVYGVLMVIGLIAVRRSVPKDAVAGGV